jgi:hypothetical protein
MTACRAHPDKMAEFFCPTCHLLVCLHCKMTGHHSSGDAVKHPLVPVSEAYQRVLEAAHAPDPMLDEKRQVWTLQLSKLEARGTHILKNAKSVREHLDALYQKAIGELDSLVHQKLLILKGEAHAYKRCLADMDRLRDYLTYLETGRDAALFLLSWHQYYIAT